MSKVLVAIPRVHKATRAGLERLRAAGMELVVNPHGRTLREAELLDLLPGCFATIAGGERYDERVFAAAPELKVVARMGVGYDAVDVAAASRHGVAVAMGFGTNHEAVADMAFALMAALSNRLFAYHREVMEGRWGGHFQPGLWRSTVGIVGLGRIGRALARRCRGFEMRVLAHDPIADRADAAANGIELAGARAGVPRGGLCLRPCAAQPRDQAAGQCRAPRVDEAVGLPDQHRARRPGRRARALRGAGGGPDRGRRARRVRGRAAAGGLAAARPGQRDPDAALRRR